MPMPSEVRLSATLEVPVNACRLRDTQDVRITEGEDKKRKFSMVALTGKALDHWWFGKLAIDLSGIAFKQTLPVLKDHDTDQRVGYTTKLSIEPGRGLIAEGAMLDNEHARGVLSDHDSGFPWQASTYLQAKEIQKIALNESAMVNGQQVQGPATIFRKSVLREVTFTALGVDDDTTATPLAAASATIQVALQQTEDKNEMNPEDIKGDAALALEAKLKAAREEATKAERDRCSAILKAGGDRLRAVALAEIEAGSSLLEATLKINESLTAMLSSQGGKNTPSPALDPVGNGNRVDPVQPTKLKDETPEQRWEKDAALRDEWLNDKGSFLAYEKHKGQHRQAQSLEQLGGKA